MTDLTGFNLKKQIFLICKKQTTFHRGKSKLLLFFFVEENDKKRPLGSAKAAALSF